MKVAPAPSTVKPAPSAAAESAAPLATVMLRSETSSVVVFRVVVVPLTTKLPESVRSVPPIVPTVILGVPVRPDARAAVPDVSWLPAAFTPGKLIAAVPLNDTPPIFLAVASAVAVAALPEVS